MMKLLLYMSRKSFKKHRALFTNLGLGILFCAFFLYCLWALTFGIKSSFDKAYSKLNAPYAMLSIDGKDISHKDLIERLSKMGVPHSPIIESTLATKIQTPNREYQFAYLAYSQEFDIAEGYIFINSAIPNVQEGNVVSLKVGDKLIERKVSEKILDPIHTGEETKTPFLYVDLETFNSIRHENDISYLIPIMTKDTEFLNELNLVDTISYKFTSYDEVRESYLFRYEILSYYVQVISVFMILFLLSLIFLLSKMLLNSDFSEISTLKVIGFSNKRILVHYAFLLIFSVFVFGISGALISHGLLSLWLGNIFSDLRMSLVGFPIGLLFSLVVISLITLPIIPYLSKRIAGIHIVDIKISENERAVSLSLPTPKWLSLNIALLEAWRERASSVFLCVLAGGMMICVLIVLLTIDGIGKRDSHLSEWGFVPMDVYVVRKGEVNETDSGLLERLESDGDVSYIYAGMTDNIAYRLPNSSMVHQVNSDVYQDKIPDEIEFQWVSGRNPENPNEVAIGMNFANKNNLTIGDKIFFIRNGKEKACKVIGIYPSYRNRAYSVRLVTDDIEKFFDYSAKGYYSVVLKPEASLSKFVSEMNDDYKDFDFLPMKGSGSRSALRLFRPLLGFLLSFLLLTLLISNLMKKIVIKETSQTLSVIRKIGFTLKALFSIIRWRFLLPILSGMFFALPITFGIIIFLMKPVALRLGMLKIPIYLNPWIIYISIVVVSIFLLPFWTRGKISVE